MPNPPFPCILISHESFERPDGVKNRQAVLDIISAANKRKKHSVIMCINGHYHRDFVRILDDVCYFEMNSVSFEWVSKEHDLFPEELKKEYSLIHHSVIYNDPLFAVVTIENNTIEIQGMESSMFMGITREMTPNPPLDRAGRPVTPTVQSMKITLG